jgi:hypothetical protein
MSLHFLKLPQDSFDCTLYLCIKTYVPFAYRKVFAEQCLHQHILDYVSSNLNSMFKSAQVPESTALSVPDWMKNAESSIRLVKTDKVRFVWYFASREAFDLVKLSQREPTPVELLKECLVIYSVPMDAPANALAVSASESVLQTYWT